MIRMDKKRTAKRKTAEWTSPAVRSIGRLRVRWENDVRVDLAKINIHNLSKMAMDRNARKRTVQQAKLTKSCSAKRRI